MLQLLGIRQRFYQVPAAALSIYALRVVSILWWLFVLKSVQCQGQGLRVVEGLGYLCVVRKRLIQWKSPKE